MSANISLDNYGAVRPRYHFEYYRGRPYIYNATDEIAYWHRAHGKTQFMREYAANWQYQQEKKMTKFKVGDTVKIINPEYDEAEYPGIHTDTFTVAEARDDSHTYPYILSPKPNGVIMNVWTDEELKLTKETDMTEFKIGDKVKLKDYTEYNDHKRHTDETAIVTDVTDRHIAVQWKNGGTSNVYFSQSSNPYKVQKELSDIVTGDTLIYSNDWSETEYTVGARINDVVVLIDSNGHVDDTVTIKELKDNGHYTLPKVEEPEVELTVAQIAEKLGHKVKVVEG